MCIKQLLLAAIVVQCSSSPQCTWYLYVLWLDASGPYLDLLHCNLQNNQELFVRMLYDLDLPKATGSMLALSMIVCFQELLL
jgi:hypothetical protein